MKRYKEFKIESIIDIDIGDIILLDDNTFALVVKKGITFFHEHSFIKAIHINECENHREKYKIENTYWGNDFKKEEIILKPIIRNLNQRSKE